MAEVVDLVPLLVWTVAFAALYLLAQLTLKVQGVFTGLPWPFDKIGSPIADALGVVYDGLKTAADSAQAHMTKWWNDVADWVLLIIALPVLLYLGVKKALTYAWQTAIPNLVEIAVKPVRALANEALTKVENLTRTVASDVVAVKAYAVSQASSALEDAKTWARTEISAAVTRVEIYADQAVTKLRTAEDAAIADAVAIAHAAKTAGETAASKAESAAEAAGAKAIAQSETAASSALEKVRAIAIGAETDLTDFEQYVKSLGLPKLIAGSAALATVVSVALAETGLENASCRAKVKQICGTDPAQWATLLAGIAAIGVAFNLADVVRAAGELADEVAPLLAELGSVAAGAIDDAGDAIGELALKIAA